MDPTKNVGLASGMQQSLPGTNHIKLIEFLYIFYINNQTDFQTGITISNIIHWSKIGSCI